MLIGYARVSTDDQNLGFFAQTAVFMHYGKRPACVLPPHHKSDGYGPWPSATGACRPVS